MVRTNLATDDIASASEQLTCLHTKRRYGQERRHLKSRNCSSQGLQEDLSYEVALVLVNFTSDFDAELLARDLRISDNIPNPTMERSKSTLSSNESAERKPLPTNRFAGMSAIAEVHNQA